MKAFMRNGKVKTNDRVETRRPVVVETTRALEEPEHEPPLLRVDGLTVGYEDSVALQDVSFILRRGERVAVLGPNGAGKSTLLKTLAGILKPRSGQLHLAPGPDERPTSIALISQRSQLDWSFPATVFDVVLMGRTAKIGLFRRPGRTDREIVRRSLELVGLNELADRQISELSGGQQQRMFIARALVQEATLMLMDEPFTGLDVSSKEAVYQLLDTLQEAEVTVMVATHDLDEAAERFNRVMLLNGELVGFGLAADVFTPERLSATYGGRLQLLETDRGTMVLADTCRHGGVPGD